MECKSLDGDFFLSMLAFLTHKIFKSCVDMGWIFQILLQHREDNFETCDLLIYLHVDLKFHNLVLLPLNPDLTFEKWSNFPALLLELLSEYDF